jgi:hypothetical protein
MVHGSSTEAGTDYNLSSGDINEQQPALEDLTDFLPMLLDYERR